MLSLIEFVNGFLSFILVLLSFLGAGKILSKYRENRRRDYLFVGISSSVVTTPWWSASIVFVFSLFMDVNLTLHQHLFSICLIPIGLIAWIFAFTDFLMANKQKSIIILYSIICFLFELVFFYYYITEPSILGEIHSEIDIAYQNITLIFLIFVCVNILLTGMYFGFQALYSDNIEVQLKGKMLILGFSSFLFFVILDLIPTITLLILMISRIGILISGFFIYIGFILPVWIRNLLLSNRAKK